MGACHTLIRTPEAVRDLKCAVDELASWASHADQPPASVYKRLHLAVRLHELFPTRLEDKCIPDSILTQWDRLHAFCPDVVHTQLNLLKAQFEPVWLEFIWFRLSSDWENSTKAMLTTILAGGTLAVFGHRNLASWLCSSKLVGKVLQQRQMASVFMNIFHLAYSAFHGVQVIRAIAHDVALRVQ